MKKRIRKWYLTEKGRKWRREYMRKWRFTEKGKKWYINQCQRRREFDEKAQKIFWKDHKEKIKIYHNYELQIS